MPITPGATGADFDVLLQFSLDEEANKRVQSRVSTIEQELKRIQDQAKKTGQAVNQSMNNIDTKTQSVQKSVVRLGAEMAKLGDRAQQSSRKINASVDSTIQKFKQLEEAAKRARQQSAMISGAAARGVAMSGQLLGSGLLVTGGIIAEANRYAKEEEAAGRATRATREWTKATEDLARARARVDNVLLKEALPLLQEAARVASSVADFISKNPQLVQAALKIGVVMAGLGAVGLAVSKGIKLVADTAYIAAVATEMLAARLHNQAADKELAAAALRARPTNRADDLRAALGQTAPSQTSSVPMMIGVASLIIAGLVATAAVTSWIDQLLEKTELAAKRRAAQGAARDRDQKIYAGTAGPLMNPQERRLQNQLNRAIDAGDTQEIERLKQEIKDLGKTAGDTADELAQASDQLAGSANESAVVDIFTRWREDDARLIREAAENRKQIIADAERQIAEITRNYASQRVAINQRFNDQRGDIISSYNQDLQQAEQNYAQNRARIIQDAGEEIQRIEEQHQENIRKMTLEHNQRTEELTAARDALGLVKEERRFAQERAEAERGTNKEIAQKRREIAQRLTDLAEQFALERAQRQAQFIQALAENEQRRQEELKQAALAHQEELKQAREAEAQKLRELQEALNTERLRRREVMIAEIRDLDAGLLGERNLKQGYYNLMLADAEAWLAAYRAKLASLSTISPTAKAYGGYASYGLYQLGDAPGGGPGPAEFVMAGSTTRAAERAIGGQLTQENLVRALTGMASGRNVSYYDQRRMDRPLSKDDRNAYRQGALDVLQEVFSGA